MARNQYYGDPFIAYFIGKKLVRRGREIAENNIKKNSHNFTLQNIIMFSVTTPKSQTKKKKRVHFHVLPNKAVE